MYKILLTYVTDKNNVSEELLCEDANEFNKQWIRLLRKWAQKIIPELSYFQLKNKPEYVLLDLIKSKIDYDNEKNNKNDIFTITAQVISEKKLFNRIYKTNNIYDVLSDE